MALNSKTKWHSLEPDEVFANTKSSALGLAENEATARLKKLGLNELPHEKPYSKLRLFFNQFNNPLMLVMVCTVVLSFVLKHYTDTIIMLVVILSNVIVA